MAVTETYTPAPQLSVDELQRALTAADLLLLPEHSREETDGSVLVGFRPEAQELRVALIEAGCTVDVVVPPGATQTTWDEHDADWVLPLLVYGAHPVVMNLVSTQVQKWIDRIGGPAAPKTLKYRDVQFIDGVPHYREIEGEPAEVHRALEEDHQRRLPPPGNSGGSAAGS